MKLKTVLRKRKITFGDRINEIGWPLQEKGKYKDLFKNKQRICHICGLRKERDLRPFVVITGSGKGMYQGYIECIRCTLTGAGDCDLGFLQTWRYADTKQMIDLSAHRKKWAEHDKYEMIKE